MTGNNSNIGHRSPPASPPQLLVGGAKHNTTLMNGGHELSPTDNSTEIITRRPFESSPVPPSPADNSKDGANASDSVVALKPASSHRSLISDGDLSRLSRRSRGSTGRHSAARSLSRSNHTGRRQRGGGGRSTRRRVSSSDDGSVDKYMSDEFLSDGSGDFFEAGSDEEIEVDEASGDGYLGDDGRGYVLDDHSMTSGGTFDDHSVPSLGSSAGGSTRNHGGAGNRDESERLSIAVRETQAVHCLRVIVLLTLAILASLLAVTLYVVSHDAETQHFQDDFDDLALQIGTAWKDRIGRAIAALDTLSVYVASSTLSLIEVVPPDTVESVSWPFVTVPEFHIQCDSVRQNLGGGQSAGSNKILQSISLVPVVKQQKRDDYEIFTRMSTSTWINEATDWEAKNAYTSNGGKRYQRQRQRNLNTKVEFSPSTGVASQIFAIRDKEPIAAALAANYYPIRQNSPVVPQFVNYNLLSNGYAYQSIWQTRQAQSEEPLPLFGPLLLDQSEDTTNLLQLVPDLSGATNSSSLSAMGTLWYPIFDSFDARERSSVGYFFSLISWPQLLEDILPHGTNGVTCIVKNSCDQRITLILNGADAVVLGTGGDQDEGKSKFQDMSHEYQLASLDLSTYSTTWKDSHSWFTQQEQNYDGTCHEYTLKIIPSRELEELYVTNLPVMYAVSVGVSFLLAAVLFLLYDRVVERRQKLVLKSAVEARAIVSSLFPAVVRERLFQNTRERRDNNRARQQQPRMSFRIGGDGGNASAAPEPVAAQTIPSTLPRGSVMHEVIPESPMRSPSGVPKVSILHANGGSTVPATAKSTTTGSSTSAGNTMPKELTSPDGPRNVVGTLVGPPPLLSPIKNNLRDGKENNNDGAKTKTPLQHPKHRLKNFLAGSGAGQGSSIFGGNASMDGVSLETAEESDDFSLAKPIADLVCVSQDSDVDSALAICFRSYCIFSLPLTSRLSNKFIIILTSDLLKVSQNNCLICGYSWIHGMEQRAGTRASIHVVANYLSRF